MQLTEEVGVELEDAAGHGDDIVCSLATARAAKMYKEALFRYTSWHHVRRGLRSTSRSEFLQVVVTTNGQKGEGSTGYLANVLGGVLSADPWKVQAPSDP
eukprot:4374897-Amphidinium_carterae.1